MNLFDDQRAHARATDPGTSHAAAASVERIRASQNAILRIFARSATGLHDQHLIAVYRLGRTEPPQSESGIRSRRSELVALGKIQDSGRRVKLDSGRMSIVWELA